MAGVDHLAEFMGWLSTKGCGTIGQSLWADVMPDDSTGVATFVLEERGPQPVVLQSTSYIRRPRMRIVTRSTQPGSTQGGDYPDVTGARNRSQQCWAACMDVGNTLMRSTVSGSTGWWLFAIPESDPFLDGRDDHNRVLYSFFVGAERQDR